MGLKVRFYKKSQVQDTTKSITELKGKPRSTHLRPKNSKLDIQAGIKSNGHPCKKNKKNDEIILAHFLFFHFVLFPHPLSFPIYFFLSIMHWVKRLSMGIRYFPIDMIPLCLQYSPFFTLCRHYGLFLCLFTP